MYNIELFLTVYIMLKCNARASNKIKFIDIAYTYIYRVCRWYWDPQLIQSPGTKRELRFISTKIPRLWRSYLS